jgi:uridine phosphorylase
VLVGDPGRALLLAQELLEEPKMSNHTRGLWGYSGRTPAGDALTIQATGIGGPSAALVLGDLAELGVRRAVRVGTCVADEDRGELGELLLVGAAVAEGGSAASQGVDVGETVLSDPRLTTRLREALGDDASPIAVASFDAHPSRQALAAGIAAADMQTASLLAAAESLRIEAAAVLIVAEIVATGATLDKSGLEDAERRAGRAVAASLSG